MILGREAGSTTRFSYVRLEERVPINHPLRPIRALADEVLAGLNTRLEALYPGLGRPSIPPEMLLRATLPTALRSDHFEKRSDPARPDAPSCVGRSCTDMAVDGYAERPCCRSPMGFRLDKR